MTLASTPATAGTSVSGWLLPTPTETRIKLETVVMQTKAIDEPRARPLRTLSAVAAAGSHRGDRGETADNHGRDPR